MLMNCISVCWQCQKELLDTELELYNQQCDGGDATELYKRVAQLRKEIKTRNASLSYMNVSQIKSLNHQYELLLFFCENNDVL